MKKRIIISLLSGAIIYCTAVKTLATTGIVKVDTLRLRKGDSTEAEIITVLSTGEKVEVIEKTANGWYKVKYGEFEGYVSGDYLNVKDEKIETPVKKEEKQPETTVPDEPKEITTNEETTNNDIIKIISKDEKLYGLPLINANTIKVIENDTQVKVLVEINGWSYISTDVLEGWVRTEKLKNTEDSTNSGNVDNTKNSTSTGNNNNSNDINNTSNNNNTNKEEIGYISANTVNFRKEPSTSADIISGLTLNKEVTILEKSGDWVKIRVNGETGYVFGKYVSNKKVDTTSRSSEVRKNTENVVETNSNSNTSTKNTQESSNNIQTATNTTKTESVSTSVKGEEIVEYAKQYVGYKYVYGGSSPSGFDCSGFTQYVYKHFGYSLTRTSSSQASNGTAVSKGNMQPGDIICFSGSNGSTTVSHVGIYIGGGKFVHAANSRRGVIISNVDGDGFFYVCSRRII